MSIELILAPLDEKRTKAAKAMALKRVAEAVRERLRKGRRPADDADFSATQVVVDLHVGTAEIHADHAIFSLVELDPFTVSVIYDVAKAGEMFIYAEGAQYSAIVTKAAHRERLPDENWRTEAAAPMCRSARELGRLLAPWFALHAEYRDRAISRHMPQAETPATAPRNKQTSATPKGRRRAKPAHEDVDPGTVDDWSAPRPTEILRLSDKIDPVPPGGMTFKYDPWVGDHIANGPDWQLVRFQRFDPDGYAIPRHPDVLRDMHAVCARHLKEHRIKGSKLVDDRDWPPLDLRMRFYSLDIWPDRMETRLYILNRTVASLLLDLGRAADMSAILPGGVALTDPGQAERVPHSWRETCEVVTCTTPVDLQAVIMRLQIGFVCDDECSLFQRRPEGWVPGTHPEKRGVVYIEAKPKETGAKHQRKMYRYDPPTPDAPERPGSGTLHSDFWQIRTPEQRTFYAYSYTGVGWLECLRYLSRSEERAVAQVVNFETFVQDDGQRFPLSECAIEQLTA